MFYYSHENLKWQLVAMCKINSRTKKRVIWENKMNDDFNMSMRKFLKQVGVTSQKAIEDALRDANNGEYVVESKITIKDIGMEHTVSGTIKNGV